MTTPEYCFGLGSFTSDPSYHRRRICSLLSIPAISYIRFDSRPGFFSHLCHDDNFKFYPRPDGGSLLSSMLSPFTRSCCTGSCT